MNFGLSAEAIEARRLGIGGSDATRIWAGEWWELYLEKIGEAKPKKIMSDWDQAWRSVTETLQLDWYEHIFDTPVSRRCEVVVHPRLTFMRCTLDGWVASLGVPINAKHLSKWTKEAREWAIEHYTPQIVHEAIVTDADYGLISLLHGEKEPEIIRIDVDPLFAAELTVKERAFWGHVQDRRPPSDMPPAAVPMLASEVKKLRIVQLDDEFKDTWPNWAGDMLPEIRRFAETDGPAKLNGMARGRIKKLLPEDVGTLTRGLFRLNRSKVGAITMTMQKGKDDE